MRIAVERRDRRWVAQVVHVGENLHWSEHVRIQKEMYKWVKENCHRLHVNGWQFYFTNEQDLTLFLLRWNDTN